jgi:hypothetical protein
MLFPPLVEAENSPQSSRKGHSITGRYVYKVTAELVTMEDVLASASSQVDQQQSEQHGNKPSQPQPDLAGFG